MDLRVVLRTVSHDGQRCDIDFQAGDQKLNTLSIDLSPGIYVIRFRTNDGVQIVKLPVML